PFAGTATVQQRAAGVERGAETSDRTRAHFEPPDVHPQAPANLVASSMAVRPCRAPVFLGKPRGDENWNPSNPDARTKTPIRRSMPAANAVFPLLALRANEAFFAG